MDANNTKYHLIYGERDWLPVLMRAQDQHLWWDRERHSVSLAPRVQQLTYLDESKSLSLAQRRGAAFDHFGNIYWIGADRKSIVYQPVATPLQNGQYWHVDDLNQACPDEERHGDFKPSSTQASTATAILSGLTVTTHGYLVVGTLQPAGVLIFDLHAGGPPLWLHWPRQLNFSPFDLACTPDGGVWILDRALDQDEARVWCLDRHFRVVNHLGEAIEIEQQFSHDFQCMGETQFENSGFSALDLIGLGLPAHSNPVAIEALSDQAFLILTQPDVGSASGVYYFNDGELVDSVLLDAAAHGVLLDATEVVGHDFAFLPDETQSSRRINGTLYVSSANSSQSFCYALEASSDELSLSLQAKLFPMRDHSGKALIASGHAVYYDFDSQQAQQKNWLPLTEQPRYRFHSEAQIDNLIKDGEEPDCVWHRIIMDACIPSGTKVRVESRAANDVSLLPEMPWQLEPQLYLRHEGSELPGHNPYQDVQSQSEHMGSWDLLLQNAVGRYLELRLTLTGTQRSTPRIRALRLYYPRFSYLERYLPDVYREDTASANFLDRFLGNVEGLFTALEDKIADAQYLFDARTTPAEFFDWLGGWLGAFIDPAWDEQRQRLFIENAFLLFRWRGTPLGLWTTIKLAISECPDASLFEPLKQQKPLPDIALGGRDVRIVENFLMRGFPGVYLGDAEATTSLAFPGSSAAWQPAMGASSLHKKYQDYVSAKYQLEGSMQALNEAWNSVYISLSEVLFPTLAPEQEVQRRDWQIFTRDFLGFSYAHVTEDHLALYQDFLTRRYQQIERLNNRYGLTGDFEYLHFSDIPLPETLPQNIQALSDWIEFVSLVLPINEQAHRFTVLLPTELGELPASMAQRKAQVEEIVRREKPAHTEFEVQYFWALFQVGSARLGIDSSIGEGSRFTALVLGMNFLGQSFLAESHPWRVVDRTIVGRDRLRTREQ